MEKQETKATEALTIINRWIESAKAHPEVEKIAEYGMDYGSASDRYARYLTAKQEVFDFHKYCKAIKKERFARRIPDSRVGKLWKFREELAGVLSEKRRFAEGSQTPLLNIMENTYRSKIKRITKRLYEK